jgi:hypothetical protein
MRVNNHAQTLNFRVVLDPPTELKRGLKFYFPPF